jgi:hypothetical protein
VTVIFTLLAWQAAKMMAERKKVHALFTWQADSLKVPTVLKAFVISFWVYVVATYGNFYGTRSSAHYLYCN